jgi:iron complex outermembrane receptor protein
MSQQYANFDDYPDVERIEVLKGPQGTLFGRNATGGAISVTTKGPTQTFQADASIEYGSFNTVTTTAFASGPLTQDLSGSVSGFYTHDDGYYKNLVTSEPSAYKRGGGIRVKLMYTPNDRLSMRLEGHYSNINENANITSQPLNGDAVGEFTPGVIIASKPWTTAPNVDPSNAIVQIGGSLRIRYDFDAFSLTGLTARESYLNHLFGDGDTTPVLISAFQQRQPDDDVSQEFQVASKPEARIQWVGGLFYFNSIGGYAPIYFISAGPTTKIVSTIDDNSFAAFGEATLPIIGHLSATVGLRYSVEEKRLTGNIDDFPGVSASKTWYDATPRIVLQYTWPQRANIYASYSKGFKSGVYNTQTLSTTPVNPEKVNAYEVGIKSLLPGAASLSLAGFHYDYDNIQVFDFRPAGSILENAANAKINGFEAEGNDRWANGVSAGVTATYTDGYYGSYPGAAVSIPNGLGGNQEVSIDATGKKIVRTPRWTFGVSLGYEMVVAGGDLSMSANLFYSAGLYFDAANIFRTGPYQVLNAHIAWKPPSGNYEISVVGNNLTNKAYLEDVSTSALAAYANYASPRYVGGKLRFFFK